VGPATLKAYKSALNLFLAWLQEEGVDFIRDFGLLDGLLLRYFEHLADNPEEGGRQRGINTRTAVLMFLPNARWSLNYSLRALKGWSRRTPPKPRPPIPGELVILLIDFFRKSHSFELEWITRACFEGYLRLSEALGARAGDFDVSNTNGVLALPKSKTGMNQSIVVHQGEWLALTRKLLRSKPKGARLINVRPEVFRKSFNSALAHLGAASARFTPHSLRHGGATWDYLQGVPIADIVVRGRWTQAKTASRYIQQGRAALIKLDLSRRLVRTMRSVRARALSLGMVAKRKHRGPGQS
jgi:integrase